MTLAYRFQASYSKLNNQARLTERKSGGEWTIRFTSISTDGTKSESVGTTIFGNDGKTWTIKSGSLHQAKDEWTTEIWRRIGK